jgi:putative transcriptional regulator
MLDLVDPPPSGNPCRVFSGYAGWGRGQLEAEIGEQAWFVLDAVADDVFTADPEGLWSAVLRRQGGRFRLMSTYPPDPDLN